MMSHIKRILGITHKVRPVTIHDVSAAEQDPELERRSKAATARLVQEMMKLERRSWEIRQELASGTLRLVVNVEHRERRGERNDEE